MIEIEIKAALCGITPTALAQRAIALGFRLDYACRERDTYYNAPDRDFRKTDEALRVREHMPEEAAAQAYVTYKGPKRDDLSQTRRELETAVAEGEALRGILAALGYRVVLAVSKARKGYVGSGANQGVNLCLDEVDGLGAFIELECPVPEAMEENERESNLLKLLSLLDDMNVSRASLTRKSYLELLMQSITS